MDTTSAPRVLFVYYPYTGQASKVTEDTISVLERRAWDVRPAAIEFTDPRYVERFSRFPLKHCYLDVFRMFVPQMRRATGEIRIPPEVQDGEYDLADRLVTGASSARGT